MKIPKVSSAINLDSKHGWAMSNYGIDTTKNFELIGIKTCWRWAGLI